MQIRNLRDSRQFAGMPVITLTLAVAQGCTSRSSCISDFFSFLLIQRQMGTKIPFVRGKTRAVAEIQVGWG